MKNSHKDQILNQRLIIFKRQSGLRVSITASHENGLGSIPGPDIVHSWLCVLLNVVTPRRSDGTLNRGLVCVAHQTWTVKIPTVTEEENL